MPDFSRDQDIGKTTNQSSAEKLLELILDELSGNETSEGD